MSSNESNNHFYHVFWFIVGLVAFGAAFTIFLVVYLPPQVSERVADTALIFWLSTAVSGGIGYLLGSNATQKKQDLLPDKIAKTNIENEKN
jgi:hypothetical protein